MRKTITAVQHTKLKEIGYKSGKSIGDLIECLSLHGYFLLNASQEPSSKKWFIEFTNAKPGDTLDDTNWVGTTADELYVELTDILYGCVRTVLKKDRLN